MGARPDLGISRGAVEGGCLREGGVGNIWQNVDLSSDTLQATLPPPSSKKKKVIPLEELPNLQAPCLLIFAILN